MELFSSVREYNCYAYGRLSKEDGDKTESDSIKNQRDMIRSFIERNADMRLCMEGYDDGYTGTNFDRPHFREMLDAVKSGKVNCVVVKDLSRFGREYIEAGRCIEKLFPALDVRFIAINDGYDSLKPDLSGSLMLPFKNLINDSYSRDISIKIRSHFDVKRRNGDFIGAFASYGYRKAPENNNRLVVDTEAADVVRDIFAWRISGMSCQSIADQLNGLGILSPMEYKRSKGFNYESGYKVYSKTKWTAVAVCRILRNRVYLGIMEQGKRTTPNYKIKTVVERPESEWFCVEGTHEAIITQEDYELVGALKLRDTRSAPGNKTVYPLSGLLFCGDCLNAMDRKVVTDNGKKYSYYICATHRQNKNACFYHGIREEKLVAAVLAGINLHIKTVVDLRQALEAISRRPMRKISAQKIDRQLASLREELKKKQAIKNALYRRHALGEVSREDFEEFRHIFANDCRHVEDAIARQQTRLNHILESGSPDSPWIEHFRRLGELSQLVRASAVRLVDRVLVYADGRVDIAFRYQEQFELAMRYVELKNEEPLRAEVV